MQAPLKVDPFTVECTYLPTKAFSVCLEKNTETFPGNKLLPHSISCRYSYNQLFNFPGDSNLHAMFYLFGGWGSCTRIIFGTLVFIKS